MEFLCCWSLKIS